MPLALSIAMFTVFWLTAGTLYFVYRLRRPVADAGRVLVRRVQALAAEQGLRLVEHRRGSARRSRYDLLGPDGRPVKAGLTYFQLQVMLEQARPGLYTQA